MSNLIPAQPNTRFHFQWRSGDDLVIDDCLPVVGYSESDVLLLHFWRTVWVSDLAGIVAGLIPVDHSGYFTIDGKDTTEDVLWPEAMKS